MATSAQGIIAGIGENNPITRDAIATWRRFCVGNGDYIINGLSYVIDGTSITIKKGEIYCFGYIGYLPNDVVFYIQPSTSTNETYYIVYCEFDLSKEENEFSVNIKRLGNSKNYTLRQDALSYGRGVRQFMLYMFAAQLVGNVTSVRYEEGMTASVYSIKRVYASDNALKADGTINSGVLATTQSASDNSKKVATTAFVAMVIQNRTIGGQ